MSLFRVATVGSLVVSAASFATPARAAPGAHPVKAELACGVVGPEGFVRNALSGGNAGKVTGTIQCTIHVADPKEPSHMGHIHTVRHLAGGKKVTTNGTTDDFGADSDPAKKDFQVTLEPGAKDAGAGADVAFVPCEDFDIVATISDDLGVYFTKKITVTQSCPKPKPVAAVAACEYTLKDGKPIAITPKTAERPSNLDAITCTVKTKDGRVGSNQLGVAAHARWDVWKDDGTKTTGAQDQVGQAIPSADGKNFAIGVTFDTKGFPNCQDVELELSLRDDDGAIVFTKKLHTTITCGE